MLLILLLCSMYCVKNLILSAVAIEWCSTKYELPSSSCKVAGVQPLVTAAMWTILDAAGFLDPSMAFTYRKNDVT